MSADMPFYSAWGDQLELEELFRQKMVSEEYCIKRLREIWKHVRWFSDGKDLDDGIERIVSGFFSSSPQFPSGKNLKNNSELKWIKSLEVASLSKSGEISEEEAINRLNAIWDNGRKNTEDDLFQLHSLI